MCFLRCVLVAVSFIQEKIGYTRPRDVARLKCFVFENTDLLLGSRSERSKKCRFFFKTNRMEVLETCFEKYRRPDGGGFKRVPPSK